MSPMHEAIARYLEAKREFIAVGEKCTLKGWIDHKSAIVEAFRLQRLYVEQEARRFEYVLSMDDGGERWRSVTELFDRVGQAWGGEEEEALSALDAEYGARAAEIRQRVPLRQGQSVIKALEDASRDPEWNVAKDAVARRIGEVSRAFEG